MGLQQTTIKLTDKSYSSNYLKIYFWKVLGIVTGMLSMLIVIPRISSQPEIYGIYAVCMSFTIFFTYADIGFLGAGQKYAAESFGRNDRDGEIRVLGFVLLILSLFAFLFFIIIFTLSIYPELIIKSLSSVNRPIASGLLQILACSSFLIVIQRFSQIVFSIRIEEYIYQRIDLFFTLLKISSVFFFFTTTHYNLIGYFLFFQGMSFCSALLSTYIIRKKYRYDFVLLIRSFRLTNAQFMKTKNLAFSSFSITISWILYYELDSIIISKVLGAVSVGIYAIGLTLLSFTRTLYSTIYGPFLSRFNHFIGQNNEVALMNSFDKIVRLTIPLCIFPPLAMVLLMRPMIISWVGLNYENSVVIAQLLISGVFWYFITYPVSFMIIAKEKINLLYINAIILPVIFYTGILLMFHSLGLVAFSFSKFMIFSFNGIFMIYVYINIMHGNIRYFLNEYILPIIIPGIFFLVIFFFLKPIWINYIPSDKQSLVKIILVGVLTSTSSIVLYYIANKYTRHFILLILKKIKQNVLGRISI